MAFHKGKRKPRAKREKPEFDQQIVDLARVTRVTKGGKQLSFRACLVIGDRKGRVGFGVQKGKDVQIAVEKALKQAKKRLINLPIVNETVPHAVAAKFKAAEVMIKPAPPGSGIIAGGALRTVLELGGLPNASAKMLSRTSNKITVIKAAFKALESFKHTTSPQRAAVEKRRAAGTSKKKVVAKVAAPKTETKKAKAPKKEKAKKTK